MTSFDKGKDLGVPIRDHSSREFPEVDDKIEVQPFPKTVPTVESLASKGSQQRASALQVLLFEGSLGVEIREHLCDGSALQSHKAKSRFCACVRVVTRSTKNNNNIVSAKTQSLRLLISFVSYPASPRGSRGCSRCLCACFSLLFLIAR